MNLKLQIFLVSFSLVLLSFFASCSKTAVLFVDPASEAYFSLQGFPSETLKKAASRSGYSLVVVSLKLTEPFSDQIEAAWRRNGGKDVPLIFPALLEPEAIFSKPHFPDARILLLSPAPAEPQEGILSIQYSRKKAFEKLGHLAATWSKMSAEQRVRILFVADTQAKKGEQETLNAAFAQNGGDADRLVVHSWDVPQSADALKSLSESVKSDRDLFLLLFMGRQNAEFAQLFSYDKRGIMASEQLSLAGRDIPGLIASIDIPWDLALENLLIQSNNVSATEAIQTQSEAVLVLYSSKLF